VGAECVLGRPAKAAQVAAVLFQKPGAIRTDKRPTIHWETFGRKHPLEVFHASSPDISRRSAWDQWNQCHAYRSLRGKEPNTAKGSEGGEG